MRRIRSFVGSAFRRKGCLGQAGTGKGLLVPLAVAWSFRVLLTAAIASRAPSLKPSPKTLTADGIKALANAIGIPAAQPA
jgi:hypothetical protein